MNDEIKNKRREYMREYYKNHREQIRENQRRFRLRHLEEIRENARKYAKENSERMKRNLEKFKETHNWSKYCGERRKARVERLKAAGCINAWYVCTRGDKPKYKEIA